MDRNFPPRKSGKGAFVSESALHSFDGDKPNSVEPRKRSGPDDHSSRPSRTRDECLITSRRSETAATASWCDDTRGLAGRLPFLCFVLHRMGFFMPRELLRER